MSYCPIIAKEWLYELVMLIQGEHCLFSLITKNHNTFSDQSFLYSNGPYHNKKEKYFQLELKYKQKLLNIFWIIGILFTFFVQCPGKATKLNNITKTVNNKSLFAKCYSDGSVQVTYCLHLLKPDICFLNKMKSHTVGGDVATNY